MDTEDHITELRGLAAEYDNYCTEAEAARILLANAIREAAKDGVRQVEVVGATGYTREQVRRIVGGADPKVRHMRRRRERPAGTP